MENSKRSFGNKSHVVDAASELLNESKKYANELYTEGKGKVNEKVSEAEDQIKMYSDKLLKNVQANPVASVLIAAGVGFVLAKILK